MAKDTSPSPTDTAVENAASGRRLKVKASISADKSPDGNKREVTFYREVPDDVQGYVDLFGEETTRYLIDRSLQGLIRASLRPALEGAEVEENGKKTTRIFTDAELEKIVQDYKPGAPRGRSAKSPFEKIVGNLDALSDEELEALRARLLG